MTVGNFPKVIFLKMEIYRISVISYQIALGLFFSPHDMLSIDIKISMSFTAIFMFVSCSVFCCLRVDA